MRESTWHISRSTLSRPFQIDVRFLHFHRIPIVKSTRVPCNRSRRTIVTCFFFFTPKRRNSRDKLVCERRKAKQQADFRGMEKVWSIEPPVEEEAWKVGLSRRKREQAREKRLRNERKRVDAIFFRQSRRRWWVWERMQYCAPTCNR